MIELVQIWLIITLIYITSIIVLQIITHCSTKEARKKVNKFLTDLLPTTPKESFYNYEYGISVGIDSFGNCISNEIDNCFKELEKIFSIFFFVDYKMEKNRLVYIFSIAEEVSEMSEENKYKYCLSLCNSILHKFLHKTVPNFRNLSNLVSISLNKDYLTVYIAENIVGQKENARQTQKMLVEFRTSNQVSKSLLVEDWDE